MTYPEPPTTFEALLAPFPDLAPTANALRRIIQTELPDATETVSGGHKFGQALYSLDGPNDVVCGLQPSAAGCKFFLHGVRTDPTGRLRIEGSGKYVRHVKLAAGADIDEAALRDLVRLARSATRS